MGYLTAALVLVAAVTLVNLVLTLGIVRKLRHQPDAHGHAAGQQAPPAHGLPEGAPVPAFTATTFDGDTLTSGDIAGRPAIVAFLSVSCQPCQDQLPLFAERAREFIDGGGVAIGVVAGGGPRAAEFAHVLVDAGCAVVPEPESAKFEGGPMSGPFLINLWPGFVSIDVDGAVSTPRGIEELPVLRHAGR